VVDSNVGISRLALIYLSLAADLACKLVFAAETVSSEVDIGGLILAHDHVQALGTMDAERGAVLLVFTSTRHEYAPAEAAISSRKSLLSQSPAGDGTVELLRLVLPNEK
jgi:hypothetical protein